MKKFKKPLLFTLAMAPIAVIATVFVCLYQLDLYPPEIVEEAMRQLGSKEALIAAAVVQNSGPVLVCSFLGCILADKLGLWKPLKFEKANVLPTVFPSVIAGVLFSLDYWTFGSAEPLIQEATMAGMSVNAVITSILYGGIVEEILMRLFLMSLIAWIIGKLFRKKMGEGDLPQGIFIGASVAAALLFAAGHLPATITTFGALTPMLLFRCFLLNGGFGLLFGRLYRKYGIWYAMLSHMLVHIVSKLIWGVLL